MDYERFVFITGVTKFCHVSLFSKLNNLTDITMDARYATMLGYTQEEFETYFADRIELASKQLNIPSTQLLPKIKDWYDGYRFHEDAPGVYNPVSLAEFFSRRFEFNNYWFSTGTPSFLLELIISQKPAIISAGFFLRRQNILECFCLYTGVLVVFSSAIADQYLAIPLVLTALHYWPFGILYNIVIGTFLLHFDGCYHGNDYRFAVLLLICILLQYLRSHVKDSKITLHIGRRHR